MLHVGSIAATNFISKITFDSSTSAFDYAAHTAFMFTERGRGHGTVQAQHSVNVVTVFGRIDHTLWYSLFSEVNTTLLIGTLIIHNISIIKDSSVYAVFM